MPNALRDSHARARPLFKRPTAAIIRIAEEALSARDREAYTFALCELQRRKRANAVAAVTELETHARRRRVRPIPRLEEAHDILLSFRARRSGSRHVYVILLRKKRKLGFYIGQTGRDPIVRYDQHKSSYKASRHVRDHGQQLMLKMTSRFRDISASDANRIERDLAMALKEAEFLVEGGH